MAVMDVACSQLPWAKGDYVEEEDSIWHPHDLFEMLADDNEEDEEPVDYPVDRVLDDDWFVLKYTTDCVNETLWRSGKALGATMAYPERLTGPESGLASRGATRTQGDYDTSSRLFKDWKRASCCAAKWYEHWKL